MTGETEVNGRFEESETTSPDPEKMFPLPILRKESLEIFVGLIESLKRSPNFNYLMNLVVTDDGLILTGADQMVYGFTTKDLKLIQSMIQTLHTDRIMRLILLGFIDSAIETAEQ